MTTTEKLDYIKNNIHLVADYPNDRNPDSGRIWVAETADFFIYGATNELMLYSSALNNALRFCKPFNSVDEALKDGLIIYKKGAELPTDILKFILIQFDNWFNKKQKSIKEYDIPGFSDFQ